MKYFVDSNWEKSINSSRRVEYICQDVASGSSAVLGPAFIAGTVIHSLLLILAISIFVLIKLGKLDGTSSFKFKVVLFIDFTCEVFVAACLIHSRVLMSSFYSESTLDESDYYIPICGCDAINNPKNSSQVASVWLVADEHDLNMMTAVLVLTVIFMLILFSFRALQLHRELHNKKDGFLRGCMHQYLNQVFVTLLPIFSDLTLAGPMMVFQAIPLDNSCAVENPDHFNFVMIYSLVILGLFSGFVLYVLGYLFTSWRSEPGCWCDGKYFEFFVDIVVIVATIGGTIFFISTWLTDSDGDLSKYVSERVEDALMLTFYSSFAIPSMLLIRFTDKLPFCLGLATDAVKEAAPHTEVAALP
jgi:hypothetical protein